MNSNLSNKIHTIKYSWLRIRKITKKLLGIDSSRVLSLFLPESNTLLALIRLAICLIQCNERKFRWSLNAMLFPRLLKLMKAIACVLLGAAFIQ